MIVTISSQNYAQNVVALREYKYLLVVSSPYFFS